MGPFLEYWSQYKGYNFTPIKAKFWLGKKRHGRVLFTELYRDYYQDFQVDCKANR